MSTADWILSVLLGFAVLMALFCTIFFSTMRDAYQRLHYSAPVTTFTIGLIALSVWLREPEWPAKLKVALIAFLLFFMNAILTHATARAIRIRETGKWEA